MEDQFDYTEEDDLFNDADESSIDSSSGSEMDGELENSAEGAEGAEGAEDTKDPIQPLMADIAASALGGAGDDAGTELTGVERFLSSYGVNGGIITFDDGETARFSDLSGDEQEEILNSLTKESVPTIEEKYNLDEQEIQLLNTLRENDQSAEEFINNIVDFRLKSVIAQKDAQSIDFESMDDDAVFVRQLKDNDPEITDDAIASELDMAKQLSSFESTIGAIRNGYIAKQREAANVDMEDKNNAFNADLELQREHVVQSVEGMTDIAGAPLSTDMKEYLLHDIMELNDNKDPILMEKIFSNPETMFKANWFLNYGEDYISNLNNYWKKEVSKAAKNAYNKATHTMPGEPQGGHTAQRGNYLGNKTGGNSFGEVVSEEDLFE